MMRTITLASPTDFSGWRTAAVRLAEQGIAPEQVHWSDGAAPSLFGSGGHSNMTAASDQEKNPTTVKAKPVFWLSAERAVCLRDDERFARLYQLYWRMQRAPNLLEHAADRDVVWLRDAEKAIRRDIHKTHAFVRFRKVGERQGEAGEMREQFAAWFEPSYRTLELSAPFFRRRFANMDWIIVTPDATAIWDGSRLHFREGGCAADAPDADAVEDQWRIYFSSIFNPARLKVKAMCAEMPKKYWRNLPEAKIIPNLIAHASARMRAMEASPAEAPNPLAARLRDRTESGAKPAPPARRATLADARRQVRTCTRCDIHQCASQAVFGEGPEIADLMIVGEQPGDQEDISGRPFIGPAGQVLDAALARTGIDRGAAYVTNAVKHFKFEPRGKKRIHQKPRVAEIDRCRWWLDLERRTVRPSTVIALGASAVRGLTGRSMAVNEIRGKRLQLDDGAQLIATVHPSHLLRLRDEEAKQREWRRFLRDLKIASSEKKYDAV